MVTGRPLTLAEVSVVGNKEGTTSSERCCCVDRIWRCQPRDRPQAGSVFEHRTGSVKEAYCVGFEELAVLHLDLCVAVAERLHERFYNQNRTTHDCHRAILRGLPQRFQ